MISVSLYSDGVEASGTATRSNVAACRIFVNRLAACKNLILQMHPIPRVLGSATCIMAAKISDMPWMPVEASIRLSTVVELPSLDFMPACVAPAARQPRYWKDEARVSGRLQCISTPIHLYWAHRPRVPPRRPVDPVNGFRAENFREDFALHLAVLFKSSVRCSNATRN